MKNLVANPALSAHRDHGGVRRGRRDTEDLRVELQRMTLTVEEAAKVLGISRALAYELVRRGELPSRRLGRRIVVPRYELEAFIRGVDRPQAS